MPPAESARIESLLRTRTKPDLVAWLAERAQDDEDLHRALTTWLVPQTDPKVLTKNLRSQITQAWAKVRSSRNVWKMARPTANALEPVLGAIEALLNQGEVKTAESLLARFHDAAITGCEGIDDSYGILWPVLQDGIRLWGLAWAQITQAAPNQRPALAAQICDLILDDPKSLRDYMVRDFTEALGTEGLHELEHLLNQQAERDTQDPDLDAYDQKRTLRHLGVVADALKDPDRYIDVQRRKGTEEIYGLPIARRLLDAGRAEEALARLDALTSDRNHFSGEQEDAPKLRIRCLTTLGRGDEARDQLWNEFTSNLSQHSLDRLRDLTPEPDHAVLQERALSVAAESTSPFKAANFYADIGETQSAASIVLATPEAFGGIFYDTQLRFIDAFTPDHPHAAWHLYRNLLLHILDEGRHNAYGHAASYLDSTRALAKQAGLTTPQQELEDRLQRDHRRKTSFWKKVST